MELESLCVCILLITLWPQCDDITSIYKSNNVAGQGQLDKIITANDSKDQ